MESQGGCKKSLGRVLIHPIPYVPWRQIVFCSVFLHPARASSHELKSSPWHCVFLFVLLGLHPSGRKSKSSGKSFFFFFFPKYTFLIGISNVSLAMISMHSLINAKKYSSVCCSVAWMDHPWAAQLSREILQVSCQVWLLSSVSISTSSSPFLPQI